MNKEQIKKRIEKLRNLINHHRYLYHVLDKQEISDSALDSLKKELFDLEQKFPKFITPDSPTQRVGGEPLEKFKKTKHPQLMLSFNDAFSEKDMEDWLERIKKLLSREEQKELDFYCELKFDGLAVELVYEKNMLKVGSTRGDGSIGEDVTQNIKTIEAIPLSLRSLEEITEDLKKEKLNNIINISKSGDQKVIVRGEALITAKEFKRINRERQKQGLSLYANPRNIAAGSIRQLNPKITAKRNLDFYTYSLITDLGQETHEQEHKILKILGFKIHRYNRYCKDLKKVFEFRNYWQKHRSSLPFEIDGIVVSVNNNGIFKKLGVVGKAPRGAIAFKFHLKQATTKVLDIKVQIGRTGAATPVAVLKPVELGGVVISRATLHNEDEIKKLGIKIGDTVIVGRAGDVIPDIIKVLSELRTGREKKFEMPKLCPSCKTAIIKAKGEAVWRCPNPGCFARRRRLLYHFVSKKAFDIEGLGPKIIDKLLEENLLSDTPDLFTLKQGDLTPLERFAEKSAENLVSSIQSRKTISLPRFIYALGIRNVGEETARDLAEHFGSLRNLKKANIEGLQRIKDIGPIAAKSISDWFSDKKNIKFLEKIEKAGVKVQDLKIGKEKLKLKGKIFVLTGALERMTREEAKEKIRKFGGDVSSSVSGNTDFLIKGKEPGSKYEKAKKLGIKIIGEEEFLKMI